MARPPIAQMIYEQRLRLGLSIRQAASRAGISEGSWRRTEGERKLKRTDETIAKMAGAVDVTAAQLAALGWHGAAKILVTLSQPAAPAPVPLTDAELRATMSDLKATLNEVLRAVRGEPDDQEDHHDDQEDHHEDNGSRRAG